MNEELSKNLSFEKNDLLERKKYALSLTTLLLDKNTKFNTICINSSWGNGKTWFVHMWIKMIKDEFHQQIIPVYYNAWVNDDFENAFIPLLSEIDSQLSEKYSGFDFDNLRSAAGALLLSIANGFVNIKTKGIIDITPALNKLKEKKLFSKYVSIYSELKEQKKDFKNELKVFASESSKRIIIFIDELDRCRPTFAIETLERTKHFFDIDEVFFVLLLDKNQLGHSVTVLYGNDCDTVGYLSRFIDIEFNLPLLSMDKFIDKLFDKRRKNVKKFIEISSYFELSLREYEKLVYTIEVYSNLIAMTFKSKLEEVIEYTIIYLVLLKMKDPESYNIFFNRLINYPYRIEDIPTYSSIEKHIEEQTGIHYSIHTFHYRYIEWSKRRIYNQQGGTRYELLESMYKKHDIFNKIHSITSLFSYEDNNKININLVKTKNK